MLKIYNKKIKQIKKINFPNSNFPIIFILKKKQINQNIQKEYEYKFKINNFIILKTKQRQFLNILKKTYFKKSLLSLNGNLIFLYYKNNKIKLHEHILYFLENIQKLIHFNSYFQFCLILDFQQNLIISKTLLNYYSLNFNTLFLLNIQKIYKLVFNSIIKLNNFFYKYKKIKGDIA